MILIGDDMYGKMAFNISIFRRFNIDTEIVFEKRRMNQ